MSHLLLCGIRPCHENKIWSSLLTRAFLVWPPSFLVQTIKILFMLFEWHRKPETTFNNHCLSCLIWSPVHDGLMFWQFPSVPNLWKKGFKVSSDKRLDTFLNRTHRNTFRVLQSMTTSYMNTEIDKDRHVSQRMHTLTSVLKRAR